MLGPGVSRAVANPPRWLDVLVPLVVVFLLAAPALLSSSGFVDDWVNHLWLTWMQSRQIRATGFPSLFLNATPLGVFYPNFLFYGGTLYAIGGYLTVLVGSPTAAFVGMLTAALCAAYVGTLWTARQAGLSGLEAHLPAIVVVTGAYYLSLAYGRGSWPELMATSAIPVLIAAGVRIVRRGPAPGAIAVLGLTTIIWSGSHNITLAWGTIFLVCVAAALLLTWAPQLTASHLWRLAIVIGIALLGVMVNGWFLLPDIRYSLHTGVAQVPGIATAISDPFSRLSIVFDPLRARASTNPYLRSHFTELPVLVIAWLALALALGLRSRIRWGPEVRRLLGLIGLLTVGLLVLVLDDHAWDLLPASLAHIQFTFRLQTYIVMAIAGAVIVVLRTVGQQTRTGIHERALSLSLALIVAAGLALGCWQVWNSDAAYYPTSAAFLKHRSAVLRYPNRTPPTWYVYEWLGSFRDASLRVLTTHGSITLDPAVVRGDTTTQEVTIPAGSGPLASNIAAPPYIAAVRGLRVVGRTAEGYMALERPADGRTRVRLTVSRAATSAMRLGPFVTLLGVLGLCAAVIASAVTQRRRRPRPESPGESASDLGQTQARAHG